MPLYTPPATGSQWLIASSVLGSAGTFDFNSIPNTYNHLLLILQLRSTANSGVTPTCVLNADTGANYYRDKMGVSNTTVSGAVGTGEANASLTSAAIPGATDTAGRAGSLVVWFPNYAGTTFHKEWQSTYHSSVSTAAGGQAEGLVSGTYASTSAISRIQLDPSSGTTFVTGSGAWLYGIL